MIMRKVPSRKIGTFFAIGFLCMSILLLPVSKTGEVQEAEAQFEVTDIAQTLINTLAQLSAAALEQKELVIDGLFYDIAQQALQQMISDILEFVNSGFDGEPAFITDLGGYLEEKSDDVAGKFIYGEELSTLCTPFKEETIVALAENYVDEQHEGFKKEAECTIDDYGADIEAFANGDFNAGGWATWFEAVLNPENTAIGAYASAKVRLNDNLIAEQTLTLAEYQANQGFKSVEACVTVGSGDTAQEECGVTTPGILIKEQAVDALGAPMEALLNADEMNEVIGTLFANLATQALTGINGLLGLGSDTTYGVNGDLSYLDAIVEEGEINSEVDDTTGNQIEEALVTETRVLELQLAIVEEIDAVLSVFEDAYTPFAGDSCWSLEVPEKLSETLNDLLAKVPTTIAVVTALQDLVAQLEEANSDSAQLEIFMNFTSMQEEGLITGQAALIEYDLLLNSELKEIIEAFEQDIEDAKASCE